MKRLERIDGAKYERNYVYNFHYHLIWVTKYRKAVFTNEALVAEMEDILRSLAQKGGYRDRGNAGHAGAYPPSYQFQAEICGIQRRKVPERSQRKTVFPGTS